MSDARGWILASPFRTGLAWCLVTSINSGTATKPLFSGVRSAGQAKLGRFIPATNSRDERIHILKLDVDHTLAGWRLEDNFRGEWTEIYTRHENIQSIALDAPVHSWAIGCRKAGNRFRAGTPSASNVRCGNGCLLRAVIFIVTSQPMRTSTSKLQFRRRTSHWSTHRLEQSKHHPRTRISRRQYEPLFGPWQSATLALGAQMNGPGKRHASKARSPTTSFPFS